MAQGKEGDEQNDAASSQSLTEETIATGTLTSPCSSSSDPLGDSLHAHTLLPMPSLPFDLVAEILCRLPVKFLQQLRCVCKSWNSLISHDPNFAKKHLRVSITRNCHHLIATSTNSSNKKFLWDSPIPYFFSTVSTRVMQTQLWYPFTLNNDASAVCSCDGIICFAIYRGSTLLCNPSIRKWKILPYLEIPQQVCDVVYAFGHDPFTGNYKVISVFDYECDSSDNDDVYKTQVKVHTLGTDYWKRIQDFPSGVPIGESGIFVNGTVNWLSMTFNDLSDSSPSCFVVSLDLGNESYQEILLPDYGGVDVVSLTLGALRDCLCIFSYSELFIDVWLMKEYGNKESWTKLISVPYIHLGFYAYTTKVVYVSEDDQVLLEFRELLKSKLVVYDSRNGTFKTRIQNSSGWMVPKVYVESLISPCS